jgi:hypothetical protein
MSVKENNQHAINNMGSHKPIHNEISQPPPYSVELKWLLMYGITDDGNIYSHKSNKYLKHHKNDNGYYRVACMIGNQRKSLYIHRLVAEAYLVEPTKNQIQVNHKDMNRLNNNVSNLEWVTPSENTQHSVDNNPEQYKHLQKKVARLDKNTEQIIDTFNGIKQASRSCNVNSGSIVKVCKGIRLSAGGYKWKYAK